MKSYRFKIAILFLFVLQINSAHAQLQAGNQKRAYEGDSYAFKVENAAGIVRYDTDIVFKKIKIKKAPKKQEVSQIIAAFNHNVDKIKFVNSVLLNEVRTFIDVKKMEAKLTKNEALMRTAKVTAKQRLQPIRFLVATEAQKLNNQLEKVLSKKQFKKWKRYVENEKRLLKPKAPDKPRVNAAKAGAMRNNYNRQRGRRY
ncbi:MAG: hypothetical protein P8K77_01280 [Polaribacter sp.]|nr:hypothetical protein [Polaribacter sp.]